MELAGDEPCPVTAMSVDTTSCCSVNMSAGQARPLPAAARPAPRALALGGRRDLGTLE
ncbi:hypothetical protein RR46_07479 [Papilio xuthus]|uniref:Uncharacterized protein n=1 Tax=Papilio xuthus TaxID=66420 RepID=A0A194Q6K9_PAPXU|nr:hypothetical protein RR46_07479 [Papilio xuthus]